ncbi:MAG TPA: hypothetical protein VGA96_09315 [Fibrella sp.]
MTNHRQGGWEATHIHFIIQIMSKPVYTSIPPTTDNVYWMLKFSDGKTSIYVPRDKDLDRQLKIKFQAEVAARTSIKRKRNSSAS